MWLVSEAADFYSAVGSRLKSWNRAGLPTGEGSDSQPTALLAATSRLTLAAFGTGRHVEFIAFLPAAPQRLIFKAASVRQYAFWKRDAALFPWRVRQYEASA